MAYEKPIILELQKQIDALKMQDAKREKEFSDYRKEVQAQNLETQKKLKLLEAQMKNTTYNRM
jgi:hypothetical protein